MQRGNLIQLTLRVTTIYSNFVLFLWLARNYLTLGIFLFYVLYVSLAVENLSTGSKWNYNRSKQIRITFSLDRLRWSLEHTWSRNGSRHDQHFVKNTRFINIRSILIVILIPISIPVFVLILILIVISILPSPALSLSLSLSLYLSLSFSVFFCYVTLTFFSKGRAFDIRKYLLPIPHVI